MQKRLFSVEKNIPPFKNAYNRFVIQVILNLIIEKTVKTNFKTDFFGNKESSISEIIFYKKDFLHIQKNDFKRKIDEARFNIKTIGELPGLEKYLNLLVEQNYIIPASYNRPGQIIFFEKFNDFTKTLKRENKLEIILVYDPKIIKKLLEDLNDSQGDYVFETKRISFNIFNGVLTLRHSNRKTARLKIPKSRTNYNILISLLRDGYITINKIKSINSGVNVVSKMSVIRGLFAIRHKHRKSIDYLGISIENRGDRYVLAED